MLRIFKKELIELWKNIKCMLLFWIFFFISLGIAVDAIPIFVLQIGINGKLKLLVFESCQWASKLIIIILYCKYKLEKNNKNVITFFRIWGIVLSRSKRGFLNCHIERLVFRVRWASLDIQRPTVYRGLYTRWW